jgi:hypothetical protein
MQYVSDLISCSAQASIWAPIGGLAITAACVGLYLKSRKAKISIGAHPDGAAHSIMNPFGRPSPFWVEFSFVEADVRGISATIKQARDASNQRTEHAKTGAPLQPALPAVQYNQGQGIVVPVQPVRRS